MQYINLKPRMKDYLDRIFHSVQELYEFNHKHHFVYLMHLYITIIEHQNILILLKKLIL